MAYSISIICNLLLFSVKVMFGFFSLSSKYHLIHTNMREIQVRETLHSGIYRLDTFTFAYRSLSWFQLVSTIRFTILTRLWLTPLTFDFIILLHNLSLRKAYRLRNCCNYKKGVSRIIFPSLFTIKTIVQKVSMGPFWID